MKIKRCNHHMVYCRHRVGIAECLVIDKEILFVSPSDMEATKQKTA